MKEVDSPGVIGVGESSEDEYPDMTNEQARQIELDIVKPYIHENDRGEALELDGKDLPQDFLMAQLALTNEHKKFYLRQMKKRRYKEELR